MIIDGHAHACGLCRDASSIEKYLKEQKIDMVILCGGEKNSKKNYSYPMISNVFKNEKLGYFFNKIICSVAKLNGLSKDIDEQNEYVYRLSKDMPQKVINTFWVNPLDGQSINKMDRFYNEKGFKMIKMHQCWTKFDIAMDTCKNIFSWATKYNVPIFIHLISQEQVDLFINTANKFENTRFIVAHMIGMNSMIEKLNNANVFFDLSAPQLYSVNTLKNALNKFGSTRFLLGSDTPYGKNNIEKVVSRLKHINMCQDDLDLICGKNMQCLLNLN